MVLCPHMENQKLSFESEMELTVSLDGNAQKEKEMGCAHKEQR
jgi:hypothetical protein